ncbi:MAG: hypothetical protein D6758_12270, partial [Gammaproteobacteria bacterium]
MLNRILRTWLQVLIPAVTLTACNVQETPVPELRVLGEPPTEAVLGAEYFYEWAVDGGKGIPNFTLTNAPRWLSVEWVENKFRRGIVMRGIPGITGGRVGRSDLTQDNQDTQIVLSVTDGDQLVTKTFSISVIGNTVLGVGAEVDEDTDMERPQAADGDPLPVCESDASGDWLSDAGEPVVTIDPQKETLAYGLVELKAPPVEPVVLAFQTASGNAQTATAGVDFVERSGYLTFKPGMTQCLVMAVVRKDLLAEVTEVFAYEITQVIEGLASTGEANSSGKPAVSISILDDEPRIVFKKAVMSGTEGMQLKIDASLDRPPEEKVAAFVFFDEAGSTATPSDDFTIDGLVDDSGLPSELILAPAPSPAPIGALVFNAGETAKSFTINLHQNNDADSDQDETFTLSWMPCQGNLDGLRVCAAEKATTSLTIWINEWLSRLQLSWTDGGVVADTAVDDWGRVYVARNFKRGNGRTGGEVLIFDRTGTSSPVQVIPFAGGDDRFDAKIGALHLKTLGGASQPQQALFVVGSANAYFTSLPTGSTPSLGGWDAVAERYDRATVTTPLTLAWRVQYGSDQDDFGTGATTDLNSNLYVVGSTRGTMEGRTNLGGQDGFILYLTPSGAFNYALNVGTSLDDHIAAAQPDNSNAVAFAGYSTGDLDDGPIGGRDAITGSYNVEGRVVRLDQFGSVVNDELLAMTRLSNGYVTAGYTQGSMFEGKVGSGGEDIVLAYHKTTSFPNKIVQLGTSGNDRGLTAGSIDLEAYVGGETGGALVSGTSLSGAKDGWYARYTADP